MTPEQADAVASICIFAALADGQKHPEEREHLKTVFDSLDGSSHAQVYQRVVLKQTDLAAETAKLDSPELKQLAYEMAVCTTDADGVTTDAERAFLADLAGKLDIPSAQATVVREEADTVASFELEEEAKSETLTLEDITGEAAAVGVGVAAGGAMAVASSGAPSKPDEATAESAADAAREKKLDSMVLKYSILNGALELLPQNLATMAVLPLQTKMVYRIGKEHGYSLDRKSIMEFIGVLGVGMTSQVVENFARDLFGSLAKKALGKTAGKLVKKSTGPLMTFATTYAMGQVAKQYYAGGRTLKAVDLKAIFTREVEQGKKMFVKHEGDVQNASRNIKPTEVLNMVRGKAAPA